MLQFSSLSPFFNTSPIKNSQTLSTRYYIDCFQGDDSFKYYLLVHVLPFDNDLLRLSPPGHFHFNKEFKHSHQNQFQIVEQ